MLALLVGANGLIGDHLGPRSAAPMSVISESVARAQHVKRHAAQCEEALLTYGQSVTTATAERRAFCDEDFLPQVLVALEIRLEIIGLIRH